ncbi:MAG: DNA polymerase IV [Ignavibacteria bacterium]|nr:DNA polymerase IV [Ignavibacteria bacterium]
MQTIFLLDIDCFFASVEMALHPELRGKPLCIGGKRGSRGIVACPNYEARAYGVKTAMPLRTAERLLPPDAVFMPGSHRVYGEYSERVMEMLYDFTPDIEQVSIDEAYMDVTGCLHFWNHDPETMAMAMKERIWKKCGLRVSVGIASNKVCAKIAAGVQKPDGLVIVPHGGEQEFLAPLPVEAIPGIGIKTTPKLHALGIRTVADILMRASDGLPVPGGWLGRYLHAVASGRDTHVMQYGRVEKSISRDTTFGRDSSDRSFLESTLYYLTERCCKTLRRRNMEASTVTAKVRFSDFTTVQKQMTLVAPSSDEREIFSAVRRLLTMLHPPGRTVRLVGTKVSRLSPAGNSQIDMLKGEKADQLNKRLDALREKFGYKSVQWGITHALGKEYQSDTDGYRLHSPVYEM